MTGSVTTMIIDILTGKFDIPAEEVSPDTVFDDLAVDSLALLEMSLILEKRLGVSISEGVLTSGQSVDEAARVVEALGAPAAVGPTAV
ncbi:acyl carrier protein [Streptomyces sp. NRRL S-340]|uniref:acyl carrier protein n=1 Tax=Streptomyces sp. NRRL S-340 TaxID=1463901 RepID=UPI00068C1CAF|nr:acyl carrier protein [Streptomyces sp. NRRL S-340]